MMPTLTWPWVLLFLLLLPWLAWKKAGGFRSAWRFSDHRLIPTQTQGRAQWARWGGVSLPLAGLCLAIIALAGPRWPDSTTRIATNGISIATVVDVSASMAQEDFAWQNSKISRLDGVKKFFRLFVEGGAAPNDVVLAGRPNDLIALVTFATHPETACPLTLEHSPLLQILDAQEPRIASAEGTTNPGDAIAWALHVLERAPTKRKILVFLTDGESNVPEKLTPRQAAQLAANLSIPIYAIDASPEPGPEATKDEVDEARKARETMQAIAMMTDGQYFRAQDASGLVQAYESIDRREREPILSFQYRRYHEGFSWFALAALACWIVLIALESTWWRTLP